jgi:hypothetical protein
MSDESGKTKKLSLSSGKLTLGNLDAGKMRAGPSVTGRKTVQVEVRRKRAPAAPSRTGPTSRRDRCNTAGNARIARGE